MSSHEYMRRALQLASSSVDDGGGPFGALVVRGGVVIAEGTNRVALDQDPSAHAEIVAIRRACAQLGDFRLEGCELYASCEPCPMCLGAIHWARIPRAYFCASRHDAAAAGFDDEQLHQEFRGTPDQRTVKLEQVRIAHRETAPFLRWSKKRDKTPY
ncbi:MAG: nucleoside deaminase [Nannocystaceae bacterium]